MRVRGALEQEFIEFTVFPRTAQHQQGGTLETWLNS